MFLIPFVLLGYSTISADAYHLSKVLIMILGSFLLVSAKRPCQSPLDGSVAIYLAVLGLTAVASNDLPVCLLGQYQFYFCGFVPMLAVAGCYYGSMGSNFERTLKVFVAAMALVSLIGFGQYFGHFLPYPMPWNRVYSTVGSPVFLSCLLGMSIPASIALGWHWPLPALISCLLLTQSRSGIVGALAGTFCLIGPKSLKTGRGALIAACLGPAVIIASTLILGHYRPVSLADMGRYHLLRMSWHIFKDYPWLGYGPELFPQALQLHRDKAFNLALGDRYSNCYAHNQFVNALATMGIVGFAAHCWLIFNIYRLSRNNKVLLSVGIALFVYAIFEPVPFHAKAIYALILGAAIDRSEPWPAWLYYAFCAVLLAACGVYGVFFAADRLRLIGQVVKNAVIWNDSVTLFPTMLR